MKQRGIKTIIFGLFLLVILCSSFEQVYAQDASPAEVGVMQAIESLPDTTIEVPVEIRNVTDLYAIDIEIRFDPDILFFEDADPDKTGVQPGLGTFLDAGLTLFNEVDNESGTIRFAMTQVNPSEAKSGDGIILVLYFRGLKDGESDLTISKVDLSTRGGEAIPGEGVDSSLKISSGAAENVATPIPIQLSTEMIDIPTLEPTEVPPTPTATALPPTATSTPTNASSVTGEVNGDEGELVNEAEDEADSTGETQAVSRVSIIDYWWIVLIIAAVVIGLAIYLVKTK